MIKCNLAVLLAERNLKITQVSKDTGISRTTLTSLVNNYSQGIQIETLNKLCIYLQVTPEQFFSYIPFDFSIRTDLEEDEFFTIEFTFTAKSKKLTGVLYATVEATSNPVLLDDDSGATGTEITGIDAVLEFANPADQSSSEVAEDVKKENEILAKYLGQLPIQFRTAIEEEIAEDIIRRLSDIDDTDYSYSFTWPEGLF